jgi:hypothetical protein
VALSKQEYEKALGRKLTDAEFSSLTSLNDVAAQEREPGAYVGSELLVLKDRTGEKVAAPRPGKWPAPNVDGPNYLLERDGAERTKELKEQQEKADKHWARFNRQYDDGMTKWPQVGPPGKQVMDALDMGRSQTVSSSGEKLKASTPKPRTEVPFNNMQWRLKELPPVDPRFNAIGPMQIMAGNAGASSMSPALPAAPQPVAPVVVSPAAVGGVTVVPQKAVNPLGGLGPVAYRLGESAHEAYAGPGASGPSPSPMATPYTTATVGDALNSIDRDLKKKGK